MNESNNDKNVTPDAATLAKRAEQLRQFEQASAAAVDAAGKAALRSSVEEVFADSTVAGAITSQEVPKDNLQSGEPALQPRMIDSADVPKAFVPELVDSSDTGRALPNLEEMGVGESVLQIMRHRLHRLLVAYNKSLQVY